MKKYNFSLLLMTAIFTIVATSCEKDDTAVGMTVSGTFELVSEQYKQYNDEITNVEVEAFEYYLHSGKRVVIARGPYSNGTFSLELPAIVDNIYLTNSLATEDLEPYFKVSNKKVKIGIFSFTATDYDEDIANSIDEKNKEGNGVHWGYSFKTFPLIYTKSDDISTTEGLFYYADRNCSITGSLTASDGHYTLTYSTHLKKGWNIVYHTEKYIETSDKQIRIEELSTNPVSGMKWYVRGDF